MQLEAKDGKSNVVIVSSLSWEPNLSANFFFFTSVISVPSVRASATARAINYVFLFRIENGATHYDKEQM